MTEQEKQFLIESLVEAVHCSTKTVFESLSILFKTMASYPELSLQQVLIGMSLALDKLSKKENKNEKED